VTLPEPIVVAIDQLLVLPALVPVISPVKVTVAFDENASADVAFPLNVVAYTVFHL